MLRCTECPLKWKISFYRNKERTLPIHEFACTNCTRVQELFFHAHTDTREVECDICSSIANRIISRVSINPHGNAPVSGLDDTDDLTLGKLIANKGVPAEHKREMREKRERFSKNQKAFERRQDEHKFDPRSKD